VIVVREDSPARHVEELRGLRAVINSLTSHSGMNILRAMVAPLHRNGRFFSSIAVSHSHEASLRMISNGATDVAAIDCVTYSLLKQHRPESLLRTRAICHSQRLPAPPFVTHAGVSDSELGRIREALLKTLATPAMRAAKEALLLDGVELLPLDEYRSIAELELEALKVGYAEMPLSNSPLSR
jgi:ABC-type phosphate/phosphonate transport system substrate-binding protein